MPSRSGANLRSFLLADGTISAAVGTRVHQNKVPDAQSDLYIWLSRAGSDNDATLDGGPGQVPWQIDFDIECIGTDLDDVDDLGEAVLLLDQSSGAFGDATVQLVEISSAGDDYTPRGVFSDDGLFFEAFRVSIYGYKET